MKRKGFHYGLLAVSLSALLAGCGWFNHDQLPVAKARPGADRLIAPTGTLPAPPNPRLEQGASATEESEPQVGSVVSAKGGQKAQKEAAELETAKRDAKEREAREAAEREAKAREQSAPAQPTPSEAPSAAAPAAAPEPAAPKS